MPQNIIIDSTGCPEKTGHVFSNIQAPTVVNCYPDPKSPDETSFYPRGCKDVWNYNLQCPNDDPYYIPFVDEDELIIQTRFLDEVNYFLGDESCEGLFSGEIYWEIEISNPGNRIVFGDRAAAGVCSCSSPVATPNLRTFTTFLSNNSSQTFTYTAIGNRFYTDSGCAANWDEYVQKLFALYFTSTPFPPRVGCNYAPSFYYGAIRRSEIQGPFGPDSTYIFRVWFRREQLLLAFPDTCENGLFLGFAKSNDSVVTPSIRYKTNVKCCLKPDGCYKFTNAECVGNRPSDNPSPPCANGVPQGRVKYGFTLYDRPGVRYNNTLDDNGLPAICASAGTGAYAANGVGFNLECGFIEEGRIINCIDSTTGQPVQITYTYDSHSFNWSNWQLNSTVFASYLISGCALNFEDYVDRINTSLINSPQFFGLHAIFSNSVTQTTGPNGELAYRIEIEMSIDGPQGCPNCGTRPNDPPATFIPSFKWYYNPIPPIDPISGAPIYPTTPVTGTVNCINWAPQNKYDYPNARTAVAFIEKNRERVLRWDGSASAANSFTPYVGATYPPAAVIAGYPPFSAGVGIREQVYPGVRDVQLGCCPITPTEDDPEIALFRFSVNLIDLIYGSARQAENEVSDFGILIPFSDQTCAGKTYADLPPELRASNYTDYISFSNGFIAYYNTFLGGLSNQGSVGYDIIQNPQRVNFIFQLNVANFIERFGYDPCEASIPICVLHAEDVFGCPTNGREVLLRLDQENEVTTDITYQLSCPASGIVLSSGAIPASSGGSLAVLNSIASQINSQSSNSFATVIGNTHIKIRLTKEDFRNLCDCASPLVITTSSPRLKFHNLYDSVACCFNPPCYYSIDGYTGYRFDLRNIERGPSLPLNIMSGTKFYCFSNDPTTPDIINAPIINSFIDIGLSPTLPLNLAIQDYVDRVNVNEVADSGSNARVVFMPWIENNQTIGVIVYYRDDLIPENCACGNSHLLLTMEARQGQLLSTDTVCCGLQDCSIPGNIAQIEIEIQDALIYNDDQNFGCFSVTLDGWPCAENCDDRSNLICTNDEFEVFHFGPQPVTNFEQFKLLIASKLPKIINPPNGGAAYFIGDTLKVLLNREQFPYCDVSLNACKPDCSKGNEDIPCRGWVIQDMVFTDSTIPFNTSYIYRLFLECGTERYILSNSFQMQRTISDGPTAEIAEKMRYYVPDFPLKYWYAEVYGYEYIEVNSSTTIIRFTINGDFIKDACGTCDCDDFDPLTTSSPRVVLHAIDANGPIPGGPSVYASSIADCTLGNSSNPFTCTGSRVFEINLLPIRNTMTHGSPVEFELEMQCGSNVFPISTKANIAVNTNYTGGIARILQKSIRPIDYGVYFSGYYQNVANIERDRFFVTIPNRYYEEKCGGCSCSDPNVSIQLKTESGNLGIPPQVQFSFPSIENYTPFPGEPFIGFFAGGSQDIQFFCPATNSWVTIISFNSPPFPLATVFQYSAEIQSAFVASFGTDVYSFVQSGPSLQNILVIRIPFAVLNFVCPSANCNNATQLRIRKGSVVNSPYSFANFTRSYCIQGGSGPSIPDPFATSMKCNYEYATLVDNVDIDINFNTGIADCCEEPPYNPGDFDLTEYRQQDVRVTVPLGRNPLCCPPGLGTITAQDCCCNDLPIAFEDIILDPIRDQLISIDNDIPQTFQNFRINTSVMPDCFSLKFETGTGQWVTDCYKRDKCNESIRLCAPYPDGYQDCRGNIYGYGDDPCYEEVDNEGNPVDINDLPKFDNCVRLWGSLTLAQIEVSENTNVRLSEKSTSEKWRLLTGKIPGFVVRQLENMFVAPYIQDQFGRQFKFIDSITQDIPNSSMWRMDILLERIDYECSFDAGCQPAVD